MPKKIIIFCFYLLFFLTPFIFTPLNFELFEYNKMMFVYSLTVIITGCWLIRTILEKKLIFQQTPLDIPILLFLLSQILSTIFSIDHHTSIWGYYSRSNGGLLSIISYLLLYWAFVSNFKGEEKRILAFIKSALWGGFIISIWAILEHFGHSFSCQILTGSFNDSCWVQDVRSRVFATLGQPNWLAAYLCMLIFPALYFLTQTKKMIEFLAYLVMIVALYLAFTFTFSRGATLGLVVSLVFYISLIVYSGWKNKKVKFNLQPFFIVLLIFLIANLIFGSVITRFKLLTEAAPPLVLSNPAQVTQLENGGTESSQIRLIVWKGALEIFKHYPIFGSGVETFAYSYYLYRPVEHNLVSEWDFLYNKAHNEYLNYLSTTGLVGLLTYLAMIGTFILYSLRQKNLLIIALLASYLSYLVQNFFQFSVVEIALLFYLIPALTFATEEKLIFWPFQPLILPKRFLSNFQLLASNFYKRPALVKTLPILIILLIIWLNYTLLRFWLADTHFAKGSSASDSGEAGRGYNELLDSVSLNSTEPLYHSELGYAAAAASVALAGQDATLSASLKQTAISQTAEALNSSPNNTGLWRTAIRTYYQLSNIDSSYNQKTLETVDKTISLAPTDPKLLYNKALILGLLNQNQAAVEALKKAIQLKPNYRDAHYGLGVFYQSLGETVLAKQEYETVLKLIPNDPDATNKLKSLQ